MSAARRNDAQRQLPARRRRSSGRRCRRRRSARRRRSRRHSRSTTRPFPSSPHCMPRMIVGLCSTGVAATTRHGNSRSLVSPIGSGATPFELRHDELAEERVRPAEIGARELRRIVGIERLVQEMVAGIAGEQLLEHVLALAVGGGRKPLDDQAPAARPSRRSYAAADAARDLSRCSTYGLSFESKKRRVLSYTKLVGFGVADVRRRKQARDVRVVHQVLRAQAVDFVGVDVAVVRREDLRRTFECPSCTSSRSARARLRLDQVVVHVALDLVESPSATTAIISDGMRIVVRGRRRPRAGSRSRSSPCSRRPGRTLTARRRAAPCACIWSCGRDLARAPSSRAPCRSRAKGRR